jgi:N-acetyl-gamma-glutamylphosphate reductase
MQLAIAPLVEHLAGPPQCFGVSGYSGAGTTPSDKNDTALLADNLMPYALTNHVHEREVTAQLGFPVEFMPHVAPHFRGITLTINLWLSQPLSLEQVNDFNARWRYARANVAGGAVRLTVEPSKGGAAAVHEFDVVLVATGRRPVTAGLGLAELGVLPALWAEALRPLCAGM